MFKDYYSILEVDFCASLDEIKSAYHRMSKKWHPDINHNINVTSKMQDINEAYYILKDKEKRHRYDKEYKNFKYFQKTSTNQKENDYSHTTSSVANSTSKSYYYNYTIKDEKVWHDMETARTEATKLVKEFICNLKKDGKKAAEEAWKAIYPYLIISIIFVIIGLIIHTLY